MFAAVRVRHSFALVEPFAFWLGAPLFTAGLALVLGGSTGVALMAAGATLIVIWRVITWEP
jgi:hypothetical protein